MNTMKSFSLVMFSYLLYSSAYELEYSCIHVIIMIYELDYSLCVMIITCSTSYVHVVIMIYKLAYSVYVMMLT
jgi:hypothetical protein